MTKDNGLSIAAEGSVAPVLESKPTSLLPEFLRAPIPRKRSESTNTITIFVVRSVVKTDSIVDEQTVMSQ